MKNKKIEVTDSNTSSFQHGTKSMWSEASVEQVGLRFEPQTSLLVTARAQK